MEYVMNCLETTIYAMFMELDGVLKKRKSCHGMNKKCKIVFRGIYNRIVKVCLLKMFMDEHNVKVYCSLFVEGFSGGQMCNELNIYGSVLGSELCYEFYPRDRVLMYVKMCEDVTAMRDEWLPYIDSIETCDCLPL